MEEGGDGDYREGGGRMGRRYTESEEGREREKERWGERENVCLGGRVR